jgi:HK97 family phage major capsid protein
MLDAMMQKAIKTDDPAKVKQVIMNGGMVELDGMIDEFKAQSPVLNQTPIVTELQGGVLPDTPSQTVTVPYVSVDGVAVWHATSGDTTQTTDREYGAKSIIAGLVRATIRIPNRFLADYDWRKALPRDIAKMLAPKIEVAALNGGGTTDDPVTGVRNMVGLGSDNYSSGLYNSILDLVSTLKTNKVLVNAVCISPREETSLRKEEDTSGARIFRPSEPLMFSGVPGIVAQSLPVNLGVGENESFALCGDWRSCVVLMPGGVRVLRDPYSRFLENETRILALCWLAVSVQNISDFRMLDQIT